MSDPSASSNARNWIRVAAKVLAALIVTLGAVILFGAALHPHLRRDGSTHFDASITNWFVDRRNPGLTTWWKAVTWLGSSVVVVPLAVVVIVLLVRSRHRLLALFVALAVAGAALLNALAKQVIGRDRPPLSVRLQHPLGSSFPSGHTTQATATYLALAVVVVVLTSSRVRHAGAWTAAAVVGLAVGLSRVYLGVHWTTDVIAGWLLGVVWVAALTIALAPELADDRDAALARTPSVDQEATSSVTEQQTIARPAPD